MHTTLLLLTFMQSLRKVQSMHACKNVGAHACNAKRRTTEQGFRCMNKASTESFEVYPSLSANADLNSVCLLKPVVIKPTSFF